jgi:hypothetical protein
MSQIRKKTSLFQNITTSDEAITLWSIKLWAPKGKDQCDKGWPVVTKAHEKEEQELRAVLKDYVNIYK